MRLILFSDTQVDFGNLQECETALEEVLASAAKYKPDAIIHAGDVKEAYSPVDVDTVKFCVRMVRRIRQAGHRFIILLGNHDRVSQSAESKNWLDVLQAAGAEIVTRPRVKIVSGVAVAFLPYSGVPEGLASASQAVLKATQGYSGPKLLVLHAEIAGSVINAAGRLGKGPTPEELGFDGYDAVFSGHIHKHQQMADNGWYIGSPFCQEWGEADSTKGHLLVDVTDAGVKVKQIVTKIPHWYNVEYLEKNGIVPEAGAYIRSKVPVTSKKITDQLRAEEERIRKAYGNVRIHTVPELVDSSVPETILRGSSDKEKVEQYVAATIPEEARFEAGQAVGYMVSKLDGLKEGALGGEIRFVGVEADNVLVFDKVRLKLAKLGLVLVKGVNEDWPGRSNGAGKSSLLSLIPIAMFGQTNKGQKSDAWACENNDAAATVRLILRDVAGRKLEILRGRRPHYIRLLIDGEDKSAGITGLRKNETQGLIEKVTGYDLRMLMNAVYIDQSIANGFVFGTPSGRMDLISRFQNLERFDLAQKDVSSDIKKYDEALANYTTQIDSLAEDIDDLESTLKELAGSTQTDWKKQLAAEQSALAGLIAEHAAVAGAAQAYEELQRTIDDLEIDRQRETGAYEDKARAVSVLKDRVERGRKLIKAGKCPTCSQPSATVGTEMVKQSEVTLKAEETSAERHKAAMTDAETKKKDAAKRLQRYEQSKDDLERQIKRSRERLADLQKAADEEAGRNKAAAEKTQVKTTELSLKRRYHHAALGARQALSIEMEMLEFSKKAFHRTGIPLYLSMALCPLLNKAADEYSDVFTDGNLKVSFRVEDGEFAVDIVNPSGSATVDGQSIGESAMAGIVVAFALREAAPKTNLLVMDEPGTGLDPEGCKAFARGILRLKDRFETMILVSHSPYIEGLLSGETVYTVRKREGRSKLFLSSSAKEK